MEFLEQGEEGDRRDKAFWKFSRMLIPAVIAIAG